MSTNPIPFGARVRAERQRLGLTTRAAAEVLGIASGSYTALEAGADPRYSTILRLVEQLGMNASALAPELAGKRPRPRA